MRLFTIVLLCHSYLRWFIVVAALGLMVATAVGWRQGATFSRRHERLQGALLGFADTQFLLGLALFLWLSPIAKAFFSALDPTPAPRRALDWTRGGMVPR